MSEWLKNKQIEYLLQTHNAVRSEIQMRITQRDTFAIQFIVAVGAIITLGFLDFSYSPFLFFLLPIVTIFFSVQILYSYTIHDRCHKFLCEEIEPALGKLLNYQEYNVNKLMWESYCKIDTKQKAIKSPGIRKTFFERISLVIPAISSALFYCVGFEKKLFNWWIVLIIAIVALIVFQTFNSIIIYKFNKKTDKKLVKKLSNVDYINETIVKDNRKKKVVFLDRDGTIHKDKVNTHKIEDLVYFDDTFQVLKKFQEMGYYLIIVSNQDGIKKGLYDVETMHRFNKKIIEDFKREGIEISAIYYSPFEKIDNDYSFKPNPGMLIRAKYEFNVSMRDSFFIGDQVSDVVAAYRGNVNPIMVTTGIYTNNSYADNPYYKDINPPTFSSLTECCDYLKTYIKNDI